VALELTKLQSDRAAATLAELVESLDAVREQQHALVQVAQETAASLNAVQSGLLQNNGALDSQFASVQRLVAQAGELGAQVGAVRSSLSALQEQHGALAGALTQQKAAHASELEALVTAVDAKHRQLMQQQSEQQQHMQQQAAALMASSSSSSSSEASKAVVADLVAAEFAAHRSSFAASIDSAIAAATAASASAPAVHTDDDTIARFESRLSAEAQSLRGELADAQTAVHAFVQRAAADSELLAHASHQTLEAKIAAVDAAGSSLL
jgi:chromosome segregation ATPase